MDAMRLEHCEGPDAAQPFTTANYGVTTTSPVEFAFVTAPDRPPKGGWPAETKNATASVEGGAPISVARRPLPLKALSASLGSKNARLKASRDPELLLEEAVGPRGEAHTRARAAWPCTCTYAHPLVRIR